MLGTPRGPGTPGGGIFRKPPFWSQYAPTRRSVYAVVGGPIIVTHLTKGTENLSLTATTASVTLAAGSVLVVSVGALAVANAVVGVVFNSGAQSLVKIAEKATGTTTLQNRVEAWELVGGTPGTGTVTITMTATTIMAWEVASVAGAASGSGWRDAAVVGVGDTASATPSITIPSAGGDVAMAAFTNRNTTITWTTDAAPVAEVSAPQTTGVGSTDIRLALLTETGAASTSPSAVLGVAGSWSGIGWNINVAAGGGATPQTITGAVASVGVVAESGSLGAMPQSVTGSAAIVGVVARSGTLGGVLSLTGSGVVVATVAPQGGTLAIAGLSLIAPPLQVSVVMPSGGMFSLGAFAPDRMGLRIRARFRPVLIISGTIRVSG